MKKIFICILAITMVGSVAFSQARRTPKPTTPKPQKPTTTEKEPESVQDKIKPSPDAPKVAQGTNTLALTLWPKLQQTEGNLLFSPLMLSTSLAQAADTAKGQTSEQILKTLGLSSLDEKKRLLAYGTIFKAIKDGSKRDKVKIYDMFAADGFWTMKGIEPKLEFINNAEYYNTTADTADFNDAQAAVTKINAWAEKVSDKKISAIVTADDFKEPVPLVLAGTLAYRAPWSLKFKKSDTTKGQFKVSADKSVNVEMMKANDLFKYTENGYAKAVELMYVGDELSLTIFLPKSDEGMEELQKAMTAEGIAEWTSHMQSSPIQLSLPKLKLTQPIKLAKPLQEIGLTEPFADTADFSGAITGKIFVSEIIQNCCLELAEDGSDPTEAMLKDTIFEDKSEKEAATASMVVDRPFIFILRHNSAGTILMMGKVANPETK